MIFMRIIAYMFFITMTTIKAYIIECSHHYPNLETIYKKSISLLSIMKPYQTRRTSNKQTYPQPINRQPVKSKVNSTKDLINVMQIDKNASPVDTLFGYTLASSNISLTDNLVTQMRRLFTTMQEMLNDKLISLDNVVEIVIDSLQFNSLVQVTSPAEKNKRFIGTITYNIEEIMINNRFLLDKWQKQQRIDQENQNNQLAFLKLMEEEKQAYKKKAQEAEAEGWECPVCCSEIQRDFFGILECGHIFHPQCINGFLKTKIEGNQMDISCPMEGCKHMLDASEIFSYIDGQLRQKFQKFSFNQFVQKNNSCTSWCPTAGCQAVFQFDEALDNYRCPACKKHYCLRCRCDYHIGMSCQEYRINNSFDKNDQAFIKFAQGAKFKQCPKCKHWVERNTGCPTMTCRCGQQFCYDCGGIGCPHGSCSNSGKNMAPIVVPSFRPPPMAAKRR